MTDEEQLPWWRPPWVLVMNPKMWWSPGTAVEEGDSAGDAVADSEAEHLV
jgi:hypothetical protein